MRLATWNVNSLTVRLPFVLGWLEEHQPDILCMQETKQADAAFPIGAFADLGYQTVHHGDGRWNGVAIASRVGLERPSLGFPSGEDDQGSRLVAASCAGIRVHSVYVPNGRSLDSEQYPAKLAWLDRLATYVEENCDPHGEVAVCGDFNIAPTDGDVWDPAQFVGQTHVSPPERLALRRMTEWGLDDVFARFHPDGGVFSWWDYRAGDFHNGRGMRIDLVLLTAPLASRTVDAFVDRQGRKNRDGHKPSDHAPVVVDLVTSAETGGQHDLDE